MINDHGNSMALKRTVHCNNGKVKEKLIRHFGKLSAGLDVACYRLVRGLLDEGKKTDLICRFRNRIVLTES